MHSAGRFRGLVAAFCLVLLSPMIGVAAENDDWATAFVALKARAQGALQAEPAPSYRELEPILREFDALAAEVEATAPEAAAAALRYRAVCEANYLGEFAHAEETLARLLARFPSTKEGRKGAVMLEKIAAIRALEPGEVFPEWEMETIDGGPLSLEDLRGKIVLVDVWATWCPPCRAELPELRALYARHRAAGFEIVGISIDAQRSTLQRFLQREQVSWPQLHDGLAWETPIVMRYGVLSIPTNYLLDAEGRVLARNVRGAALERAVERALTRTLP